MAVFLEPPIVVEKADMPWNANTNEFNSDATVEEEVQTPETIPRAWYLSTDDKKTYSREPATFDFNIRLMYGVFRRGRDVDIRAFLLGGERTV